ncbi:MAG TPA: hypothetical protein QGF58_08645 [Myxococcota bacterium]|nr:hypothetical protein [Myxococcota bacterium]
MLLLLACTTFTVNDDSGDSVGGTGDPSGDLDCDADYDFSEPAGPDCITGVLHCGDVIEGHTRGGSSGMDSEFYRSAFCFVPYTAYDGPERVYELELEADTEATVTLEAPCSDLGFAAARWSDEDVCPSGDDHAILDCNGAAADSVSDTKSNTFWAEKATRFIVAVDGASPAAYRLTVECE